jgi:hypothetical protein
MARAACVTCDTLENGVLRALIEHLKLTGRLQVARLSHARHDIAELEPLVEAALVQREKAVAEHLAHRRTHAAEAEGAQAGNSEQPLARRVSKFTHFGTTTPDPK